MKHIPDWQLPAGVDRGLWDYIHHRGLAEQYDQILAGTPLFQLDTLWAERFFTTPGDLIDLGCGTGRFLHSFAPRGFRCTGVDISEEMLNVAKANADRLGLPIQWQQANLVDGLTIFADHSFDYAVCLFSTLGMVRGESARQQLLCQVRRILRPNGRFLLHVHNYWYYLGQLVRYLRWSTVAKHLLFQNPSISPLTRENKGKHTGEYKERYASGDFAMQQSYGGEPVTIHHFRRREIINTLNQSGFQIRKIIPIGIGASETLSFPSILSNLRAYGFLILAE